MDNITAKNQTHEATTLKHCLSLSDKIIVKGVVAIVTLQEKLVEIRLSGRSLTLQGNGFSPLHLDLDKGELILSGEVLSLKYSGKSEKESFIKRVFK